MNESIVFAKVTEVFRSVLGNANLVVQSSTVAWDVEGWDSISHIDIIVRIEKEFGIRFTMREIRSFQNVGDLIQLVLSKINAV